MTTARFFSGASLFALLIVDICCLPIQKGFNPTASYSSSYTNAAPDFGYNQGVPSSEFSPGVMANNAPSNSYQPEPQPALTFPQPAVQREPAASVGSSSSGPALSAYRAPASSTQPGTGFQSGPRDNWAVAPRPLSGGEEMSSGTQGFGSSRPENVSPPLPPPGPLYQSGELSHFEKSFENGNSEMETEEQGYLPPMQDFAGQGFAGQDFTGQGFTSQPQPEFRMGGSWGTYPYYDFMFLTGQYPPGTVDDFSSSYEQGRDNWQNTHYERYYAPYNSPPAQQIETSDSFAAPQSFEDPRQPVMAGYGQGGLPASHGSFMQPSRNPAGGYNMGKVGY